VPCLGAISTYLVAKPPLMVCGAMVLPAPAHELWLAGKDTEPPDRCHPILPYCIGWCRPQTTLLRGARSLGLGTHFDVRGSGP
jgi:hypothetical protein